MVANQQVPSRKSRRMKASLEFAKRMIREKIDGEGKFVAGANYEMSGQQLREYLAFAFREGMNGHSRRWTGEERGETDADKRGKPV